MVNNNSSIFEKCRIDEEYVWGIYFVPRSEADKIDATYTSMHFERTFIPDIQSGTPEAACEFLMARIDDYSIKIEGLNEQIKKKLASDKNAIFTAYKRIKTAYENFDVRKMAARMEEEKEDYYILCGWMGEEDVEQLLEETKDDARVFVMVEEDREKFFGEPPTKLKNPKLFKPFEMFTRMYGLPAHDEMDPTMFIALTYTFIFGAMFGDVGQGLCLFVLGGLLYKVKKMDLAGIISIAGLFSTFFGFMFGSFFGFEDVIEAKENILKDIIPEYVDNIECGGMLNGREKKYFDI